MQRRQTIVHSSRKVIMKMTTVIVIVTVTVRAIAIAIAKFSSNGGVSGVSDSYDKDVDDDEFIWSNDCPPSQHWALTSPDALCGLKIFQELMEMTMMLTIMLTIMITIMITTMKRFIKNSSSCRRISKQRFII